MSILFLELKRQMSQSPALVLWLHPELSFSFVKEWQHGMLPSHERGDAGDVGTQEITHLHHSGWSFQEEVTAGLAPEHQAGATCMAKKRQVGVFVRVADMYC